MSLNGKHISTPERKLRAYEERSIERYKTPRWATFAAAVLMLLGTIALFTVAFFVWVISTVLAVRIAQAMGWL